MTMYWVDGESAGKSIWNWVGEHLWADVENYFSGNFLEPMRVTLMRTSGIGGYRV